MSAKSAQHSAASIDVLRADWPAPPGVHALTTLRGDPPGAGFDLSHDAPACNRQRLVEELELPAPPVWLRQVHGTRVAEADGADAEEEADASFTASQGRVLAVLTADCLPVALCHARCGRLGLAHAGWRGLAAGVLERTVAAMQVPAPEMLAWLGPAIGPARFEVGDDVRQAFLESDRGCSTAFIPGRPDHWLADLYTLARRRLTAAGVGHISGGGECTFSDADRFFSYRRDRDRARMATLLWSDALPPPDA